VSPNQEKPGTWNDLLHAKRTAEYYDLFFAVAVDCFGSYEAIVWSDYSPLTAEDVERIGRAK
jgi:hypothetical protein